jgi:hypothetical protein
MKQAAAHLGVCVVLAAISCGEPPPNAAWCEQGTGGCKVGYRCDDGRGPTRGQCVPVGGGGTSGDGGVFVDAHVGGGAGGTAGAVGVDGSVNGGISGSVGGGTGGSTAAGGSAGLDAAVPTMDMSTPPSQPDAAPDVVVTPPPPPPDAAPACSNVCTASATRCMGGGLQTCVLMTDGCRAWDQAVSCPSPQTCPAGKTKCGCPTGGNSCSTEGARQCSPAGLQICLKEGACLAWGQAESCPDPQTCTGSSCSCPTAGACAANGQQCGPNGGAQVCVQKGACKSWSLESPCGYHGCDSGKCLTACPAGTFDSGHSCQRCNAGDPCCDGDKCTLGARCISGTCQSCGGEGEPCCASGTFPPPCGAGKECATLPLHPSPTCNSCGAIGEVCCADARCSAGSCKQEIGGPITGVCR